MSDSRLLLKFWLQVVLFGSGLWVAKPTWAKPPALSGGTVPHSYLTDRSDASPTSLSQKDVKQPSTSVSSAVTASTSATENSGKALTLTAVWNNPLFKGLQDGRQDLNNSLTTAIASVPTTALSASAKSSASPPPSSKKQFAATVRSRKAADLTPAANTQASAEPDRAKEYEPVLFKTPVWGEARSQSLANQIPTLQPNVLLTQNPAELAPTPTNPADPNLPPNLAPPPCQNPDPELGCLDFQAPTVGAAPVLYLIPRLDFFRSNNILSGVDPVEDGLIRPALTLLALPSLGRNTFFVASAEVALNRYFRLTEFNYNEFKFRGGIFQRLSPTMSGEIGWSNQQLFIAGDRIPGLPVGTQFLNDHAIRLELSRRDQLAKNLVLSTFYQFRWSFAIPQDRSRVINALFLSLNYDITRTLQVGLDYQFSLANFTTISRTDLYHQVLGRITFSAFRNTQMSVYGGFSRGSSTEAGINFDSFILGVSMSVNLTIF